MHTHLCGILVQEEVSDNTLTLFDKTRKGTLAELHAGEMAKKQLHNSQIVTEAVTGRVSCGPKAGASTALY